MVANPADQVAGADVIYQQIDIPGELYRQLREQPLRLTLGYSLTLMRAADEYKVSAAGGHFRSAELGICGVRADALSVALGCRQLGDSPFCFRATLYGPQGQSNPSVLQCIPDYRPYIPAPPFIVGYGGGVFLPYHDPYGLAHYAVDASLLPQAYILFKVYRVQGHFRRTVMYPLRLADVATSP
jgi:hypothetical protein